MQCKTFSIAVCLLMGFGLLTGTANADDDDDDDDHTRSSMVNCPGDSIQKAVDRAKRPTTIFIDGVCVEDVVITRDDITLSGNKDGETCNKADPSGSAGATIDGTITVDGVRARIEFLRVTGSNTGIDITNRADAVIVCNDVFDNQAGGIQVVRSSNAVLQDNMVRGNGRRAFDRPFIFFDSGLLVVDASSVRSDGNTYENNQYAAIDVERQSAFRNGTFLPRAGGFPPNPDEKDVYIQKGGDPSDSSTCKTDSGGPIAIAVFNDGLVDLRNADTCGEIESLADSSFRMDDGGGAIIGNVLNRFGSLVRISDRSGLGDGRATTFDGTLICLDTSQTFFSTVQCGQTCDGTSPLSLSCSP